MIRPGLRPGPRARSLAPFGKLRAPRAKSRGGDPVAPLRFLAGRAVRGLTVMRREGEYRIRVSGRMTVYELGRLNARYSPEYGPPLTATTMYCLPSTM